MKTHAVHGMGALAVVAGMVLAFAGPALAEGPTSTATPALGGTPPDSRASRSPIWNRSRRNAARAGTRSLRLQRQAVRSRGVRWGGASLEHLEGKVLPGLAVLS